MAGDSQDTLRFWLAQQLALVTQWVTSATIISCSGMMKTNSGKILMAVVLNIC